MKLPPLTGLRQDDTHRLIPSRYSAGGESVLTALTQNPVELQRIFELDDATNNRLLGENGLLSEIGIHELVFGVPNDHIINASFTHPHPQGSRFNGPGRGAWYAAFALETSQREIAYHKRRELEEINWQEEEASTYDDYVADFRAEFHDIRREGAYTEYLAPDSYVASQNFAHDLLMRGSRGIIYPSVRHSGGTCIVCFRPALVGNVRKGSALTFRFVPGTHSEIHVTGGKVC